MHTERIQELIYEYKDILFILLVGAFLRLYQLTEESINSDEGFTLNVVDSQSIREIAFVLPQSDPHPPLYYLLIDLWLGGTGHSVFVGRVFSVIFGVALIALVYAIGWKLYERRVAQIVAGIVAISSFHIYYAQELRMYAFFGAVAAASMYFLIRYRKNKSPGNRAGYILCTVLTGYTHVYGAFIIGAHVLFWASESLRGASDTVSARNWILDHVAIAIFLSPWIGLLVNRVFFQPSGVSTISWISTPGFRTLFSTPIVLLGLPRTADAQFAAAIVFNLLLVVASVIILAKDGLEWRTRLLGTWIGGVVIPPIILSYIVVPFYISRALIVVSLPLYLLVARSIALTSNHKRKLLIAGIVVTLLVTSLTPYYTTHQKPEWKEATTLIEQETDADELIVVGNKWTDTQFKQYYDKSGTNVRYVGLDVNQTKVGKAATGYSGVWIVFSYNSEAERTAMKGQLEREYTLNESWRFEKIRVYHYVPLK